MLRAIRSTVVIAAAVGSACADAPLTSPDLDGEPRPVAPDPVVSPAGAGTLNVMLDDVSGRLLSRSAHPAVLRVRSHLDEAAALLESGGQSANPSEPVVRARQELERVLRQEGSSAESRPDLEAAGLILETVEAMLHAYH